MKKIEKLVWKLLMPTYIENTGRNPKIATFHTVPTDTLEKLKTIEALQEGNDDEDGDYEEESVITGETVSISFYPDIASLYLVKVVIDGTLECDFSDFSQKFQEAVLSYFKKQPVIIWDKQ